MMNGLNGDKVVMGAKGKGTGNAKLKEVLRKTCEITGDETILKKLAALEAEQNLVLGQLGDQIALHDVAGVNAFEVRFHLKEAEFLCDIQFNRILLTRILQSYCAIWPSAQEQSREQRKQNILGLRASQRRLEEIFVRTLPEYERTAEMRDPAEDRALLADMAQIDREHFQALGHYFSTSVKNYQTLTRQLHFRRFAERVIMQGWRIFWGLLIFTLLLGYWSNQISTGYLSLLVIPAIGWYLQEKYLGPWLTHSLLWVKHAYLRSRVQQYYGLQMKFMIYEVMDWHFIQEMDSKQELPDIQVLLTHAKAAWQSWYEQTRIPLLPSASVQEED